MSIGGDISLWGRSVVGPYPREAFAKADLPFIKDIELERFVRLWVMEGIPYCFAPMPMLYEAAREFIADRLDLDPDHVGLIGSGRLGFSLSPDSPLKVFEPSHSDLDFFVVSRQLWLDLVREFHEGIGAWKAFPGSVSQDAAELFAENIETMKKHEQRGFVDSNKVPVVRPHYVPETALTCEVAVRNLETQLIQSGILIRPHKRPQLRVYRDWEGAIRQNVLNLKFFLGAIRM